MSGTTVTELNNFFFGMANEALMQTGDSTGEFASDLEKAASKEVDVISEDVTPKSTKTTVASNGNGKSVKEANATELSTNSSKKLEELSEDATETIGTAMQTIISQAAEILNVEPEELEAALESLNLSENALFDPELVNQIVMEINGIDNPIDLLSDANAWNQVIAINDLATDALTELSKELEVTGNELLDLLQETALADGIEEAIPATTADEILNNSQEIIQSNKEELVMTNDKYDASDAELINEVTNMEQTRAAEKKETKDDSSNMNQASSNNYSAQLSNDINVVPTEQTQETFESHLSPQEIYEQIGDFIKTQNFEDVKQVEMQLSPASLGSIQIRISQTDTGITAQLIASNEAAKSALESQLITLKENFDQAGLKVNEVEVSVSNQSFNENLEQEGNSERDREALMEEHRHETRRLNLNIFDEDYEDIELTDDIKLAKEMMEANGGSVDLKA